MKSFLIILSLVLATDSAYGQEFVEVFGCTLSYQAPDSASWQLASHQYDSTRMVGSIIYKHHGIEDAEGRLIIPNMAIVYELVSDSTDVILYSFWRRKNLSLEITKVLTWEDGLFSHRNGVGYEGEYTDEKGLRHLALLVHLVNGKTGVQIICDATEGVYRQVEPAMRAFVKSVVFSDSSVRPNPPLK